MKKLLLFLMLSLSSSIFAITTIKDASISKNDTIVGEVYIAKFKNNQEKNEKIAREKSYMMSKNEFKYFTDNQGKGGIAYTTSYSTPIEYTISFKAFCGDKYISVYGNYSYYDDLLEYFLKRTEQYGYNFR